MRAPFTSATPLFEQWRLWSGFAACGRGGAQASKRGLLWLSAGPPELSGAVLLYGCGRNMAPRLVALSCPLKVGLNGPRGEFERTCVRRMSGVLWDGSRRFCRRLLLAARFRRVPPRTRAWRLTARASWREPSRGVLGDSFRWVSAELTKQVLLSHIQPGFLRAADPQPLFCNARRQITHHSTSPTPAAALAAKPARNAGSFAGKFAAIETQRPTAGTRAPPRTPEIAPTPRPR